MYKKLFAFILLVLPSQLLYAKNVEIKAKRFSKGEIKVDGIVSQEEWGDFTPIEDFVELQPEEGKIPPVKTQVFVGYDDKNLYVAFKCYDDVKTIRKTLTPRDHLSFSDDMVLFYLWTYSKGGEGYIFATNPFSVQYDGKKEPPPNNNDDWSFDTQWEVKSFIGDSSWSAEFKIPFSSLRFETKEKQNWRITFVRIRPRASQNMYSFPKLSLNNPSIFDQSAILIIPEEISFHIKRLSLIPYVIGSQNGWMEGEKYHLDRGKFNIGGSGKYQVSPNLTLDFALNPDYSNIETDIPQIDINTTYALYYPEKRPFFMEGSDIIKTPIEVFYTRMVNNPLYAVKLTGRALDLDLYLLSAYDENALYIVPLEDFSVKFPTSKKGFINFIRVKKNILNSESYIGLILGDREMKKDEYNNGFGRIAGFDTKIRFLKHYTLSYQGVYSNTKEPEDSTLFSGYGINFDTHTDRFDGEEFDGFAHKLKFYTVFRNLYLSSYYKIFSPSFRSDIGYIGRNNLKKGGIAIRPIFYINKSGINQLAFGANYSKERNFARESKMEFLNLNAYIQFSFAQINLNLNKNFYNQRYSGKFFKDLGYFSTSIYSVPLKWLSAYANFSTGKDIYYRELIPDYETSVSGGINLRHEKMLLSIKAHRQLIYRDRYKNLISDASVFSLKTTYSFTNALSFRLTGFYYTNNKSVGISPLLTYQLTPFTVFYLGANINALKKDNADGIKAQDHQVYLKLQYVFKI